MMEFGLKSVEATDSPVQPAVIAWQMKSVAAVVIAGREVILSSFFNRLR